MQRYVQLRLKCPVLNLPGSGTGSCEIRRGSYMRAQKRYRKVNLAGIKLVVRLDTDAQPDLPPSPTSPPDAPDKQTGTWGRINIT